MRKYTTRTKPRLNATKLVHLRAGKEWTQKEAAKKAKISLPTYLRAEHGCELQLVKASRIAKAYGLKLEELEAKSA